MRGYRRPSEKSHLLVRIGALLGTASGIAAKLSPTIAIRWLRSRSGIVGILRSAFAAGR